MCRVATLGLAAAITACTLGTGDGPVYASGIAANAATNGQSGIVGRPLPQPVGAIVVDPAGGPVPGVVVTWTVVDSAGSISVDTSTTDLHGTAIVTWTLDTIARVDSLTASIASGAAATITAFGVAGQPATIRIISGNPQAIVSGSQSLPLVVELFDTYGNPVPGYPVAWSASGGGSLSAALTATNGNGQAYVTFTTGTTPGSYTVTATAGRLVPVTFSLRGM
jgi:hypothetical protein